MYLLHIQKWYLNKQLYHRMPWEKLNYTLPATAGTKEEPRVHLPFLATFAVCSLQPFCGSKWSQDGGGTCTGRVPGLKLVRNRICCIPVYIKFSQNEDKKECFKHRELGK